MAQVMVPQKNKNQGLSELTTIGGALAGGILSAGNPAGVVGGASLGASLGGAAGGLMSQNQSQGVPGIPSQGMAMQRRSQKLGTDNLATLKQAEMSLPSLPENLRQQYAPAIVQARMLEQQKRGMV